MKNILYINAGAGSGKTYRLTHMLPHYLCDDDASKRIKPSEVIVTTYTVSAAAEIKERARKVLLENKHADEASQLETAAIGTVHSICQRFIQQYWYAIGMSPAPVVISENDKAVYRKRSIAQFVSGNKYAKERQAIADYYAEFGASSWDGERSVSDPDFWTELLEKIVGKLSYYEIKGLNITDSIEASKKEVASLLDVCCQPDEHGFQAIRSCLQQPLNDFIVANKDGARMKTKIQSCQKALDCVTKYNVHLTYKNLLSLHTSLKNVPDDVTEKEHCLRTITDWLQSTYYQDKICACIDALFTMAQAWQTDYEQFKKQHGVIDYDDMEKGFLSLLNNEKIAEEIGRRYKLVMVDEFQDCNPIQLRIFDRLSDIVAKHSPLAQSSVWVGDPKQAIYGFRGSDTQLINRVASRFPVEGVSADDDGLLRDKLDESHRSRRDLVELVNGVFSKLFPGMIKLKWLPELNKAGYGKAVEHWKIEAKGEDVYTSLAQHIKNLDKSKYMVSTPNGELRPLEYSDIAILVTNHKTGLKIADKMRLVGVPVSVAEQDIFDRIEVQFMLSLLHLSGRQADNAHEWATVMHLWNGTSAEDVIDDRMKYLRRQKQLREKIQGEDVQCPSWIEGKDDLAPIKKALKAVNGMPLDHKVANLILLLSLDDRVQQWGEADARRSNLVTLQNAARSYVSHCTQMDITPSVDDFSVYLKETKLETVKGLNQPTVKIVTYHGSKGLEWPMVILANLGEDKTTNAEIKKHNFFGVCEVQKPGQENELLPQYNLIVLPNFLDASFPEIFERKLVPEGLQTRFMDAKEKARKDAIRLLYVGMTRASTYLVSVSKAVKSNPESSIAWLTSIGIEKAKADNPWGLQDFHAETVNLENPPVSNEATTQDSKQTKKQEIYQLRDIPDNGTVFDKLYLSPSQIRNSGISARITDRQLPDVLPFFHDIADNELSAMGTCIHKVFAAYTPDNGEKQNTAMAQTVISNHGFSQRIAPELVIKSISKLYEWLTAEYGKPKGVFHEVPFCHKTDTGQIVHGEMDLLWRTSAGTVLIDFKNTKAGNPEDVLEQGKDHYVGQYYPQIKAYSDAIEASGDEKVIGRVIYYATMGLVVQIDFN